VQVRQRLRLPLQQGSLLRMFLRQLLLRRLLLRRLLRRRLLLHRLLLLLLNRRLGKGPIDSRDEAFKACLQSSGKRKPGAGRI